MFRFITLIGIGLILVSSTLAQMIYFPRPYDGLSGLVHTVRREAFNCSGEPAEKPFRVDEVTYDKRGNETWRAFYNTDGSVGHSASHTYDIDGHATGWSEFYGKSDFPPNGLHKHAVFTLSNGRAISAIVYKEDKPEFKTTWEYDDRGNKISEVTTQIGCCATKRTFKYDALNRMTESTYDAPGVSSVQQTTFDAAGNVVKEMNYDKGSAISATARIFDGNRLLKEVSTWWNRTRITTNTYNKLAQLTLITIDDPSITSTTTIEYYDNGKMRSKDQVTVAKTGGPPQGSEDTPTPGRILEKYDVNGNQVERYIYDDKGALYLTQLSGYDDRGRQIRGTEISRTSPQYDRDFINEYDSHGNRISSQCRKVTDTGEVKLLPAEKKTITYYDK